MADTHRASLSIKLSDLPAASSGGGDAWAQIELEDFFWIGRCWICNLVVDDQTVSRLHATVERYGDAYRLTDMQSANGTVVNGRAVRSCVLKPGDVVRVGDTTLRFSPGRTQDRTFHEGTSISTSTGMVSVRSFPSSLPTSLPEPLPPPAMPGAPERVSPATKTGVPELDAVAAAEAALTSDAPLLATRRPFDQPPELHTFLTILADRLASEMKPYHVRVHVPTVRGQPAVSIARGWSEGQLVVDPADQAAPRRIVDAVAAQPIAQDGELAELGDLVFWRGAKIDVRCSSQNLDRYKLALGAADWGLTVPLLRVGRTTDAMRRTFRDFAWIHLDLAAGEALRVVDRVLEVAGGMCAATGRFVDRAADAEGRV